MMREFARFLAEVPLLVWVGVVFSVMWLRKRAWEVRRGTPGGEDTSSPRTLNYTVTLDTGSYQWVGERPAGETCTE